MYNFDERLKVLKNAYAIVKRAVAGRNVLLVDDLYRSGATLSAITRALRLAGEPKEIYVLTLTMTRRIR